MKRLFGAVACFLAAVCCYAIAAVPAYAADDQAQTVKVGVYGNSIYSYQDEDGIWRGIDIECLTNVAQREGLNLEFIDSANDPDFLNSLETGTYDMLTDVVPTSDRTSRFLFSDTPVGSAVGANLAVRADDGRWKYGDIEQLSQMKIGLVTSFADNETFRTWCTERGVAPQLVEYSSVGEMSNALAAGEIDGEVYGAAFSDASSIRVIMQMAPVDAYYVFRTDDMTLKNTIDQGMAQILLEDPYYLSDLNSKYVGQRQADAITFTPDEQSYLEAHPTINVAVIAHDEPYYWKDSNGSDEGILPDYFSLIAQKIGVGFRFVTYDTPDQEIAAVKSGEADVIGLYANGIIFADQDNLLITQSYASTTNVLLTKAGTGKDEIASIAVNQRTADTVGDALKSDFSLAETKMYGSVAAEFKALEAQSVDAAVCGLPGATWLLNQTNASEYNVTPLSNAPSEFCAAVNTDDRVLCSLLGKGISATKSSYDGIVTSDTLPSNDLRSFIERIPPVWLAVAAGMLAILVVGLVVMLILLRRRQREHAAVVAAKVENDRREMEIAALARSAEEKNRFFSNISHDMRTPLNAIIGFSQLAQGQNMSVDQKDELFGKITTSGNLLLDLVNDTLTLSKANSGKLELHPTAVFTEDIGAEVTIPIREAAAQKHISFSIDKSGYRPRIIFADALNLKKIFLNLLSNAVKYTPAGGHVWVTVADDPPDAAEPDLLFTIRDDGIGISQEFMPHLFEPFATEGRAEAEVTGTGLGLSIVKNLVDLMHGTIEVTSTVGGGTTFIVRLHFPETSAQASHAGNSRPDGALSHLAGARVLLCEDNAINAEVAGMMLQRLGIAFDVATNGQEGCDRFASLPAGTYDAVLMDIRMPVMDGVQATRAIRAMSRSDAKTVPIIALTADAFEEDVQRNLDAGMNAQVSKPIKQDELLATLYRLIG